MVFGSPIAEYASFVVDPDTMIALWAQKPNQNHQTNPWLHPPRHYENEALKRKLCPEGWPQEGGTT
jgi:hypothetical protein